MMKKYVLLSLMVICGLISTSQVGINNTGNPPNTSSMLDVSSDSKGFLPPRMTQTERDLIPSPAYGLQIMNTTNNCLEFYLGSLWQTIACGCTAAPTAPTASAASSLAQTAFTANWSASSSATSYRLDVATDNGFGSLVSGYNNLNVGNVTSYNVTGLTASTNYYYRVRGVNVCGTGTNSSTITAATTAPPFVCGTSTFTIAHNSSDTYSAITSSKTYGTVSYVGKCWTDRNLGADNLPGTLADATLASAGWNWQFNQKQGYSNTGGGSNTPTWNGAGISESSNWTQANDPCFFYFGAGWRIPTQADWTLTLGTLTTQAAAFSSVLKIHSAGRINGGSLEQRGASGDYWSSTQNDATTAHMFYTPNLPSLSAPSKTRGNSIRCIKD
jgi:hypothetical protein